MANWITNVFQAVTKNAEDIDRIEGFLNDNFYDCDLRKSEDGIEGEFYSKWDFPEKEMDRMVSLLEDKEGVCIRMLAYDLNEEYVDFRVCSGGRWSRR